MNKTILAIDDEIDVLKALKRVLRREGMDILLATCGEDAVTLLEQYEPAVIICDQRMPGMMGAAVLAESVRLRPDAFRITLTGYTDLGAAQASINEGQVNQFLTKPWDDDHLIQVVRQGIQTHNLIAENRRLQKLTQEQNVKLAAWNEELEDKVKLRTEQVEKRNRLLLKLSEKLESSLRDAVGVLASTLEAVSPALGLHSKRVAKTAKQIGAALNMDRASLRDLEFAAYLHDIGKIVTMAASAANTGRKHDQPNKVRIDIPEAGYEILSRVNGFKPIATAIRYQAIRYDRVGLPSDVLISDVPGNSYIIAVADAFDQSLYQTATPTAASFEDSRRKIAAGSGKMFAPNIVAAMLETVCPELLLPLNDVEMELSPTQLKPGMILCADFKNADGLLLLKDGAVLTDEMIDRIRDLRGGGALLTGIRVRKGANAEGESQPPESHRIAG